MYCKIQTLLIFGALTLLTQTRLSSGKSAKNAEMPNCQNFSAGVILNENDVHGTWHLLHFRTEQSRGTSVDKHCVEFTPMTDTERKDLENQISQYVENLQWENLSLKMQIPCSQVNLNKTRNYYLERLESNGSYRTLQMPQRSARLDLADFHRYPMRLKIIEKQYLGMMDCHEKFVFLLGKQAPTDKAIDDRLQKMIESFWPEDN
ncbi:uncharacterized protein LOC126965745 [Leptidea sinapis]|uniref:uncharacterized protein LOC126965745 n=1 Tax=Leptidea sinapis TaxID=189913 RepID=UPI0021220E0C|nr:uncharacterized protein LOC126965745 [Leptidea sinapis]